ncbi:hypothetical protein LPC08_10625 [Roseomonas sp. OT10]|uniref:hypothetical protein n=1 Tax=Roseomonas cutis TaxID=2897332 RepID=UPI001E46C8A7|nr:hypothetical protein [Roseomonas sp. OT10]UFN51023.1 hypothetical protein LPC08_10625 [Roseomonas sp. OT10]
MPSDGTPIAAAISQLVSQTDLLAARAHEAGDSQAAVILAQMAGLLRTLFAAGTSGPADARAAGESMTAAA